MWTRGWREVRRAEWRGDIGVQSRRVLGAVTEVFGRFERNTEGWLRIGEEFMQFIGPSPKA